MCDYGMRLARVMLVIAALFAALLPATASAQASALTPNLTGQVLRVAVFGGAHQRNMHAEVAPLFEKSGARVEYTLGNPRDHLAKLISTRGRDAPFDVVILDDAVQAEAIQLGVLEALNPADIPNMANLYPEAITHKGFGPAKNTVSVVIAYNSDKFKELGLPPPSTWDDLSNPKLAGRIAMPELSTMQGVYALVGLAKLSGGGVDNVKAGFEKLQNLKVLNYYRSSSDLETKFAAGDVWAAAWVNGRVSALQKAGQPVSFSDPKFGKQVGMVGFNTVDMVKGGRNKEAAKHYINLLLDADVQIGFAKTMFYGPTNRLTSDKIAADSFLVGKFPYRSEGFQKMVVLDWNAINAQLPNWVDQWNRTLRR